MNWLRPLVALVAGLSASLVLYGAIYQHFVPFNRKEADPRLAFDLIPLELLFGLLCGALVYRLFSNRLDRGKAREDVRVRMLYRLAHRSSGVVDLNALERTPLEPAEALHLLRALEAQGRARAVGAGRYQLT